MPESCLIPSLATVVRELSENREITLEVDIIFAWWEPPEGVRWCTLPTQCLKTLWSTTIAHTRYPCPICAQPETPRDDQITSKES